MKLQSFTLRSLLRAYPWRIVLTLLLVVLDSALSLLFPLFMGYAVDALVASDYSGVVALAGLGLASLVIGTARRMLDTRAYSGIYRQVVPQLVEREKRRSSSISRITARVDLLREMVEFFEESMPEIVRSLIGVVGTVLILAPLSLPVTIACLISTVLVFLVYGIAGTRTMMLNRGYNDVVESQVDSIASADSSAIRHQVNAQARWSVRLSDFESVNYAIIWLFMIGLLVYSLLSVAASAASAGAILSVLIYVFQYTDGVVILPLYYQQLMRLREISVRLNE